MNKIIYVITFFIFSGYYAVLAILISLGMTSSSRVVTVPLRLLTTALMLYVIFKLIKNTKLLPYKKWIYLFFCSFWFLYFLKIIQNYNAVIPLMRNWYEYIFYSFNFSFLPFIMYSLIDFNKYQKTILNALIFSGFVMGLVSFYLYKDVFAMGIGRLNMLRYETGEESLSPLALSYAGGLTIALCLFQILFNKNSSKKNKIYLYVTMVLSFIMFFLGASRGSVIALLFSVIILFYYGNVKNKTKFIILTIASIPIIIWGIAKTGSAIFERSADTFKGGQTVGRIDLWHAALDVFYNNPIFGGTIELVSAPGYEYIGTGNIYPHNFMIETLMATGIVGFVLLLLFLLPGLKKAFELPKKDINFIWVSIVLLQGFTQYSFSGAIYVAILLFFPLGLMNSYNHEKKS